MCNLYHCLCLIVISLFIIFYYRNAYELLLTAVCEQIKNLLWNQKDKLIDKLIKQMELKVSTQFISQYLYISSNICEAEMIDLFYKAEIGDEGAKQKVNEMVRLFHSGRDKVNGWSHCKKKKQKCTLPLQERLCDVSVYATGQVGKGNAKKDFTMGLLHCEIKSREKYFPQICHEMTVVLQHVPRAFSLSIREFEISFYQFERNPTTSKIEVHEHVLVLSDLARLPQQFQIVLEHIAKCVLTTFTLDFAKMLPTLDKMVNKGYQLSPPEPSGTEARKPTLCTNCCFINRVKDLLPNAKPPAFDEEEEEEEMDTL